MCEIRKVKNGTDNTELLKTYESGSSQTWTFNFTGIKRGASMTVLHMVVSGKCVLLLIGGTHIAGQSRDC
jgi:hypothetical protein